MRTANCDLRLQKSRKQKQRYVEKTTRQRKRTTAAPAAKVAVAAATAITTKYMRKFKRLLLPQQH